MWQYHFEIERCAWIVTLDGYEIVSFMTEAEAAAYCEHENHEAKYQTIE